MKCPNCGFENRPGARFCKGCGQPLEPPTPPPPAEVICPHCGTKNKPGARFCAHCGTAISPPAAVPSAPPPPTPPPAYGPPSAAPTPPAAPPPAAVPPPPAPPPSPAPTPAYGFPPSATAPPAAPTPGYIPPAPAYTPAPSGVPGAQPPYGPPPSIPPAPTIPPPAPEPESARRAPRWLMIVLPIVLALCLIAGIGGGYFAYRRGALPFLKPSPSPTAMPSPTATPAPGTAEAPPVPAAPAQIGLALSTSQLKVGEPLTLTVTLTNTGSQPWAYTECRLLGEWEPTLEATNLPEPSSEELPAGGSRTTAFVLTARHEGTAVLRVLLIWKTSGDHPRWDIALSDEVTVSVAP